VKQLRKHEQSVINTGWINELPVTRVRSPSLLTTSRGLSSLLSRPSAHIARVGVGKGTIEATADSLSTLTGTSREHGKGSRPTRRSMQSTWRRARVIATLSSPSFVDSTAPPSWARTTTSTHRRHPPVAIMVREEAVGMGVEVEVEATGAAAEVHNSHAPHSPTSPVIVPSMIWNPYSVNVAYPLVMIPHHYNLSFCLTLGHTPSHMSTGR